MGLKKVEKLNEGPLDFIRGASAAAGQKISQTAPVRAARDVVQAGQHSSRVGDLRKAIATFMQTYAAYQKMRPAQQPAQQPAQRPPAPPVGTPSAFKAATKPKMTPGAHGYEFKFEQFILAQYADQLDEGALDFIKGAAGQIKDKAVKWAEQQAAKTTGIGAAVRDVVNAGVEQSKSADAARQAAKQAEQFNTVKKQAEQQLGAIVQMLKGFGPQAAQALAQATKGMDNAQLVSSLIAKNAAKHGVAV